MTEKAELPVTADSCIECCWHCSDETVHYKSNEMVNFAVLDVQLRRQ